MSFVVQMVPVSVNGPGVREAAFSFYFTRVGLPIQSRSGVARRHRADDDLLAGRRGRLPLARQPPVTLAARADDSQLPRTLR
jgi:hypothetical protein